MAANWGQRFEVHSTDLSDHRKVAEDEERLLSEQLKRVNGITVLKSPCGTGKTNLMVNIYEELDLEFRREHRRRMRVLIISTRRVTASMFGSGFANAVVYSTVRGPLDHHPVLVISMESFHRLIVTLPNGQQGIPIPDLLIIDEADQFFNNFLSPYMNENMKLVFGHLQKWFNGTVRPRIWMAEAFWGDFHTRCLKCLTNDDLSNVSFIENVVPYQFGSFTLTQDYQKLVEDMQSLIDTERPFVICSTSKTQATMLYSMVQSYIEDKQSLTSVLLTGESSDEQKVDAVQMANWFESKEDTLICVAYTNVVGAGLSVAPSPDKVYNWPVRVYGIFEEGAGPGVIAFLQGLKRFRCLEVSDFSQNVYGTPYVIYRGIAPSKRGQKLAVDSSYLDVDYVKEVVLKTKHDRVIREVKRMQDVLGAQYQVQFMPDTEFGNMHVHVVPRFEEELATFLATIFCEKQRENQSPYRSLKLLLKEVNAGIVFDDTRVTAPRRPEKLAHKRLVDSIIEQALESGIDIYNDLDGDGTLKSMIESIKFPGSRQYAKRLQDIIFFEFRIFGFQRVPGKWLIREDSVLEFARTLSPPDTAVSCQANYGMVVHGTSIQDHEFIASSIFGVNKRQRVATYLITDYAIVRNILRFVLEKVGASLESLYSPYNRKDDDCILDFSRLQFNDEYLNVLRILKENGEAVRSALDFNQKNIPLIEKLNSMELSFANIEDVTSITRAFLKMTLNSIGLSLHPHGSKQRINLGSSRQYRFQVKNVYWKSIIYDHLQSGKEYPLYPFFHLAEEQEFPEVE